MQNPAEELMRRVALLALLIVAGASAQNPDVTLAQVPPIRSEVKEILVPVVVTDARGHHISGLKVSDFRVFEDGKPERIVGFGVESMTPVAVPMSIRPAVAPVSDTSGVVPGVLPSSTDPQRTYLIVVDTLHSSFANFGRVRKVLEQFFEKEKAGDAQYAVMALGRDINVVQDSTRDASAVLGAVRASRFSKMIEGSEANNLAIAAEQFIELMRNYCALCRCVSTGDHEEQPACPSAKSRLQMFLTSFAERTFLLNQQFRARTSITINTTPRISLISSLAGARVELPMCARGFPTSDEISSPPFAVPPCCRRRESITFG